ncbi:MAG: hypothetical protein O7J95_08770 [Planctomycetota bacterium]|nr:hypothetical protein [Planctomycetota bacterium]
MPENGLERKSRPGTPGPPQRGRWHPGSHVRQEINERDARPTLVAEGAGDGPAWHPELGTFFSGDRRITRLTRTGETVVVRDPSGSNGRGRRAGDHRVGGRRTARTGLPELRPRGSPRSSFP